MAQNITLLGASYSDVPAVVLPKTGGGTARFDDASVTTATASDVTSGKIFLASNGTITTGTASGGSAVIQPLSVTQNGTYTAPTGVDGYSPITVSVSGGGGASNIVTGTFKGTTTNAAMDITLNYSGSGYPVAVVIYPAEGMQNTSEGSWYSLVQRYAIGLWSSVKANTNIIPTYIGQSESNTMTVVARYKSSTSASNTYSNAASNTIALYSDANATSTNTGAVRIRSATKMSVFIAGTSYGFAANIEYKYWVLYSS